jgi:hypothetical protein
MLLDARGCLTEAGFRALSGATPGAAPPELANHLASCQRCQDRMLAAARSPGTVPTRHGASRLWLGILVAVAGLLLALVALVVVRMLAAAPP